MITACAPATSQSGAGAATAVKEPPELAPGIPNKPDLVTIIPFYQKPDMTEREKTKVVLPADIDGVHGIFVFDLGSTPMMINRTFLQPNAKGGVDTVTDASRVADNTPRSDYMSGLDGFDKAHVRLKLGTLIDDFDDPNLSRALGAPSNKYNVMMGHLWGNFGWVFSPRLGNIGPAAVEQFETIIDYPQKRVILIRLDSAGNRMVAVPAYTPRYTAALKPVELMSGIPSLGINVGPLDMLDTANAATNTNLKILDTGAPQSGGNILGYDFLSNLGVFGLNQRKHEFYLYR
jgi:hypothetical protein